MTVFGESRGLRAQWLATLLVVLLAASVLGHALPLALDGDGRLAELANSHIYYAVLVIATLCCLSRAAFVEEDRLTWALVGAGLATWTAGEILYVVVIDELRPEPYPSISDLLYLSSYPLWAAGVGSLAWRHAGRNRGAALDGAIAGLGAVALAAAAVMPVLDGYPLDRSLEAVVSLAYPIGDLVLLGVAAAGAVVLGWRRDFFFLALGLVAMALADTGYLFADGTSSYVEGTTLDIGWSLAAALLGIAALHRGRRTASLSQAYSMAVPALIALLVVALLTVDHFHRFPEQAVLLAAATLGLAVVRMVLAFDESSRLLHRARTDSLTDALTGLGNRRRLIADLERACDVGGRGEQEYVFALFDLDGFKGYNDSFGHAAGDLLLRRMGAALTAAVAGHGEAYRLGGDEFCVLAPVGRSKPASLVAAAREALSEDGEAFTITASHGQALIPAEAPDPSQALRLADRRLYAEKGRSPRSFGRQASDLLLGVLREREPLLGQHVHGVGRLAADLARRVGLEAEEIDVIARAGELHDVGKMAIPDEILRKPGPLDEFEWELMRTHTLVGERILSAAPALAPVGRLIRSSHERWDGGGYPDGLAGEAIPVGARIIAVCDAFEAMTEERPYRRPISREEAIEELRRQAGTQFDPRLVDLFAAALSAGAASAAVRL